MPTRDVARETLRAITTEGTRVGTRASDAYSTVRADISTDQG